MQFIAAKERFSQNVKSVTVGHGVLNEAVSSFGRRADRTEFRRLPGGFINAKSLAVVKQEQFVIRVYSTDAATADRECDLLKFLASTPVLAPRVFARYDVQSHPVAILEFIDAITLEDCFLSGTLPSRRLYREIGAQLAEIHRVTFSDAGFLGPNLTIGREYNDFSAFLKEFIERTLTMLLTRPDRLSVELN